MPTTQLSESSLINTQAAQQAQQSANLLLTAAGLPHAVRVVPRMMLGRNNAWLMELADQTQIFVKHIDPQLSGPHAITRSLQFAEFAAAQPAAAPRSPKLICSDQPTGLLIFEHCPGENAATQLAQESLPNSFVEHAGKALGKLHAGNATGLLQSSPPSPPQFMLTVGIPHQRFYDFTLAEISLWNSLQHDKELITATARLRADETAHSTVPSHNDLRLDQLHVDGHQIHFLDWEEFGLGDPARDLGSLAGEIVYRAILDAVTTRGEAITQLPEHFDSASATAFIAERIGRVVPSLQRLWSAYTSERQITDDSLAIRVTAHLGWHLVDRTIARAPLVSRLPGIERAAAGIGRKALLLPERFSATLGLGGA